MPLEINEPLIEVIVHWISGAFDANNWKKFIRYAKEQ